MSLSEWLIIMGITFTTSTKLFTFPPVKEKKLLGLSGWLKSWVHLISSSTNFLTNEKILGLTPYTKYKARNLLSSSSMNTHHRLAFKFSKKISKFFIFYFSNLLLPPYSIHRPPPNTFEMSKKFVPSIKYFGPSIKKFGPSIKNFVPSRIRIRPSIKYLSLSNYKNLDPA
jgi:hypothetical protein